MVWVLQFLQIIRDRERGRGGIPSVVGHRQFEGCRIGERERKGACGPAGDPLTDGLRPVAGPFAVVVAQSIAPVVRIGRRASAHVRSRPCSGMSKDFKDS